VFRSLSNFACDDSGATALEYGLVVGLVALALIAGMGFAGNVMENVYTFIADTLQNVILGG
jgi:pilus assembly protein Flp/PilA